MLRGKKVLIFLLVWLAGTSSVLAQDKWVWLGYGYPKMHSTQIEVIAFSPTTGTPFAGFDNDLIKMTSANYEDDKWALCLSETPAYAITFDSQGNVLVGSDTCIYVSADDGNHWGKMENTPTFNRIYDMLYVKDTLWVGDENAVYFYANSVWNKTLEAEGKKTFANSPQGMFVGVYGKGVYYYDSQTKEWTYFDVTGIFGNVANGADNYMADMVWFNGKLWMVTVSQDIYRFGGIVTYDGKFWKMFDPGNPLPHLTELARYFTALAVDSSGALWFGSTVQPDGAYKLDKDGNWYHYGAGEWHKSLQWNDISVIAVDSENRKWFGQGGITVLTEGSTAVENNLTNIPVDFILFQNYPNPFNSNTVISYSIAKPEKVRLDVYNQLGRKVASLVNEYQQPGRYYVRFNASNLPSGIYFYQLKAGKFSQTKKMAFTK